MDYETERLVRQDERDQAEMQADLLDKLRARREREQQRKTRKEQLQQPENTATKPMALLRYISIYRRRNGWSPSLQEMVDELHLSGPSHAGHYLDKLSADGLIYQEKRIPRGIRITRAGRQALGEVLLRWAPAEA